MRFPLDRIYAFEKWHPLNLKTAALGFGFGLAYPQEIQDKYGFKYHDGIDWPVPVGEHIFAVADGKITDKVISPEWGNGIWQDIGGTLVNYWHLSEIKISEGQEVKEGDWIGRSGDTGKTAGAHLHFGCWKNNGWIDPLTLFRDTMQYIMNAKGDQFLLFDTPRFAVGIADVSELLKLKENGLTGEPVSMEVPTGYLVYPGIETKRLADLFNI